MTFGTKDPLLETIKNRTSLAMSNLGLPSILPHMELEASSMNMTDLFPAGAFSAPAEVSPASPRIVRAIKNAWGNVRMVNRWSAVDFAVAGVFCSLGPVVGNWGKHPSARAGLL